MNLPQHVAHIRAFSRSHTRMPSYSELMAVAGFRSKHAAYKLVTRLMDQGWSMFGMRAKTGHSDYRPGK